MNEKELIEGITKDHILKSIEVISEEGYPPHRRSNTYDLVHNGVAYPPKYVLSLAGYFRDQKFIRHKEFKGGEKSVAFAYLKDLGFTIQPKAETINLKKARENPAVKGKYIVDDDEPELFDQDDIDSLRRFPGKRLDRQNPEMERTYQHLQKVYEKVEYWTQEVLKNTFPEGDYHIKKKPTNQANNFEYYLWSKIYPTKALKEAKILAYTLTLSAEQEDFCLKIDTVGLGENDPIRKKYLEYRGEFFDSPIVKILKIDEVLSKDWDYLIAKSAAIIKSLDEPYRYLLGHLGVREQSEFTNSTNYKPAKGVNQMALNKILYGPPGTGKTYKLNEIKMSQFIDRGVSKSKEEVLHERLLEYPFWQVLAAALYVTKRPLTVNELVEQPIVKHRVKPGIKTKPSYIAWSDLLSYADDESTQLAAKYRRAIKLFHKDSNSRWSITADKSNELKDIIDFELIQLARDSDSVKPVISSAEIHRYRFITFHQKYSYEDFIEGIKPVLQGESRNNLEVEEPASELAFELKKGIFYLSCLEALKLAGFNSFDECYKSSKEQRKTAFGQTNGNQQKQFALFIDEINRANISAVFGELITLIEETKRLGQDEEMWLKLPYSGEDFGVPPNLHVIGSMNTADRSIALLDIALRRRFHFEALYPDYDEIPEWELLLKALNQKIFELKKNPDFFIGHAFFINKDRNEQKAIFNGKIIPLLMEYFQNNLNTVKSVLQAAEIKVSEPSIDNNYQLIAID